MIADVHGMSDVGPGSAPPATEDLPVPVLAEPSPADSRGGRKIKQDAAYYRAYRARNARRIKKQEETRRERDRNKNWVIQTVTGVPDVGWKVLSDFQVDVAVRAFWDKRGMSVPSTTIGGILPSVSDFNEELTILEMRTS